MGRLLQPFQECKRAQAVKQNEDIRREQKVFQQLCSARGYCIDVSRQSQALPLGILC